jgi:hypothetical protein
VPSVSVKQFTRDYLGSLGQYHKLVERRLEAAALATTHSASRMAKSRLTEAFVGARLGRLGQAFGAGSDLERRGTVHRRSGGWSVSGDIHIRSRSQRTRGAIEAYTVGAEIRSRSGGLLWFPSEEIQRVAGAKSARRRITPGNWRALGMENKLGPLQPVKAANGRHLLVVNNVGVSLAGKSRSARSLKKNGQARRGDIKRSSVVAFIGIPATSRSARVNVRQIIGQVQAQLPRLYREAIRNG